MASKSREISKKSSPGILLINNSQCIDNRNRELKIRILDPDSNTNTSQNEVEERKFERMKKDYLKQCIPINVSFIQKCISRNEFKANNKQNLDVYKTSRVSAGNFEKSDFQKQIIVDRKNRRFPNSQPGTSTRIIKSGCGAPGCRCAHCACEREHCQVDCKCMRRH